MVKPKSIRKPGLPGYRTGVDGYSGISVYLTAAFTGKTNITATAEVEVDQGIKQTISESVLVTIT